MSLRHRPRSPDNPCRQKDGVDGCFTTGWQDYLEIAPTLQQTLRHNPQYERHVRTCFKRHARTIPVFLASGFEHWTRDETTDVEIFTHCSSGAPNWDPRRLGQYDRTQCNLYTLVSHILTF